MSAEERGAYLGMLAIRHFSNPAENAETDSEMKKILFESVYSDIPTLLKGAKRNSQKVQIEPEYDKCQQINKVDFTFHPLFGFRFGPKGDDLSVDLPNVPECKPPIEVPMDKHRR